VGTSGVGKSSILNALCPDLELAVGEINDWSGLGRHITSNATLHALPDGGELIDTPGFRDFGPVEVSSRDLAVFFPGFESALAEGCRFRDCLHRVEPGCSVRAADAESRLPEGRHAAYLDLLEELESAERAERRY
jgi:ribosome biogenesis GTPase